MGLTTLQDGAPKIARLPYRWLNSMVYGRYNELVNGGYFMVYKPTFTSLGGPSYTSTIWLFNTAMENHHFE